MNGDVHDQVSAAVSFEHVLVPLDGSALATGALPTAEALADLFGARLTTLSVASGENDAQELRRQVAETLAADMKDGEVEVVIAPDPAEAIRRRLDELGTALVCMSTHGRGRVAGAVIGSVARSVLQSSQAPVIALGPHADRPTLVSRPLRRPSSWPDPLSVGPIVACVDGSTESEAVLPVAASWAGTLGMDLSILTVAEEATADMDGSTPNRFGPPNPEAYVEELARRWATGVRASTGVVVQDPIGVASGLRGHLLKQPVSLVALSTHARSGMDRIRFGATAADIVRTSTAPTLVVPVPNH